MEALLRELWQLREIQELAQLMESGGGPALVTGLSPVHRAMTAAALRLKSGRPLLMLCADEGEARRQAADLRSLTGREPVLLTGRELHWRELAAVSRQWEYRRLEALYRIRQEESPVIVTTADALALRCIPPQVLDRCSFTLRSDGRYQVEELARRLTAAGGFPHEIGLFLSYPPEDVLGFILNKACNHKCVGCWKVYGDEQAAKCIFRRYKKCSKIYSQQWEQGKSIEQLTVAG